MTVRRDPPFARPARATPPSRLLWRVALALLLPSAMAAQQPDLAPTAVRFRFTPLSRLVVHTFKAGLFSPLGHEHDIRAAAFEGTVDYDTADLARSRVEVVVPTDSLRVVLASDSSDVPRITANMREDVLHVAQYPEVRFRSTAVRPRAGGVLVTGALTIHGQTRLVDVPMRLAVEGDTLRAGGTFRIRQTDFGMRPYNAGFGSVKVKDEIEFRLEVVAAREPR